MRGCVIQVITGAVLSHTGVSLHKCESLQLKSMCSSIFDDMVINSSRCVQVFSIQVETQWSSIFEVDTRGVQEF